VQRKKDFLNNIFYFLSLSLVNWRDIR